MRTLVALAGLLLTVPPHVDGVHPERHGPQPLRQASSVQRAYDVAAAALGPSLRISESGHARVQAKRVFRARLSTVPIDLTMVSRVAGSGTATATLVGPKLTVEGTFSGLKGAATAARIHRGPKGIRGPAVFDLTVTNATSGTIAGSVELTSEQIGDLANSRFYIQLHSDTAPDGNLWGWLLPQEGRR